MSSSSAALIIASPFTTPCLSLPHREFAFSFAHPLVSLSDWASTWSSIASPSCTGSSAPYSVPLSPLSARTMETPAFAFAQRLAAVGATVSGASRAEASAAAFAASTSTEAGTRKSSGTASAVSGFDPNAVAVLTNLPALPQSAFASFVSCAAAGASAAAFSPSASRASSAPNARPPGTPSLVPVARIALTCSRVAFFHFASLSTGAASADSSGAASSSAGTSSGGASTGASPETSAIEATVGGGAAR